MTRPVFIRSGLAVVLAQPWRYGPVAPIWPGGRHEAGLWCSGLPGRRCPGRPEVSRQGGIGLGSLEGREAHAPASFSRIPCNLLMNIAVIVTELEKPAWPARIGP